MVDVYASRVDVRCIGFVVPQHDWSPVKCALVFWSEWEKWPRRSTVRELESGLGGRLRTRKDTLENVFPVVRRVGVWWADVHAKEAFAGSDEPDDFNKLVEGFSSGCPIKMSLRFSISLATNVCRYGGGARGRSANRPLVRVRVVPGASSYGVRLCSALAPTTPSPASRRQLSQCALSSSIDSLSASTASSVCEPPATLHAYGDLCNGPTEVRPAWSITQAVTVARSPALVSRLAGICIIGLVSTASNAER